MRRCARRRGGLSRPAPGPEGADGSQRPQRGSIAVFPSPKLNKIFILFKNRCPQKSPPSGARPSAPVSVRSRPGCRRAAREKSAWRARMAPDFPRLGVRRCDQQNKGLLCNFAANDRGFQGPRAAPLRVPPSVKMRRHEGRRSGTHPCLLYTSPSPRD